MTERRRDASGSSYRPRITPPRARVLLTRFDDASGLTRIRKCRWSEIVRRQSLIVQFFCGVAVGVDSPPKNKEKNFDYP
jgi:hypothetical protein